MEAALIHQWVIQCLYLTWMTSLISQCPCSPHSLCALRLFVSLLAESMTVTSTPSGRVSLQAGSPLTLTCQVSGLPGGGTSGLLVQWLKRGSLPGDAVAAGAGGVEVGFVWWCVNQILVCVCRVCSRLRFNPPFSIG